jgi:carbon-monoxide dehydrogenase medium subunit
MKPAPFAWHGPRSVAEAVAALADFGPTAKVLAGGQSLVPVLAMRLAEPAHLVDINKITELDTVTSTPGGVTVGALARHSRVEHDAGAARVQPLLRQALRLVAHPTIRNRGTTVGSLAHADPAGEMTAVLALCGGTVTAASSRGRRMMTASDFFRGPLESALAPDELAVQAFFPALPANAGTAFVEIARRHGDYALCGVGAIAELNSAGRLISMRCAYLSVFDVPLVLDLTQSWLSGADDAAEQCRRAVDPQTDLHGSADYRRHLAGVLTIRAARQAISAAERGASAA